MIDGQKGCSRCGGPRDKPGQRYCKACHADYCRERREGMVEALLTPDEWELVQRMRAARLRGGHSPDS